MGYAEAYHGENADPYRAEVREEMFELRLQNERLKMEVTAAEQRLEMMESLMEMREENATLRARLEFFEAHHGQAARCTSSPHNAK